MQFSTTSAIRAFTYAEHSTVSSFLDSAFQKVKETLTLSVAKVNDPNL